jgi:SPP1 gp7 family putative phage head morphogenesis protein
MDEAEEAASQFAAERSAELVGLQRDDEGGLIEDEDATWSIAETTREKIEQIVMAEFSKDLPLDETMKNIQTALEAQTLGSGIFSEKRAQLISETEVTNAQVGGHYQAWAQAGVRRVKWITAEDERTCIPCARNDRVVRKMGERFPSGDLHPGGHPHCRCSLELIR